MASFLVLSHENNRFVTWRLMLFCHFQVESPDREIYRDPNVVRSADRVDQEIIRTNTTAKMLSLFRQMEEKTEEIPDGKHSFNGFSSLKVCQFSVFSWERVWVSQLWIRSLRRSSFLFFQPMISTSERKVDDRSTLAIYIRECTLVPQLKSTLALIFVSESATFMSQKVFVSFSSLIVILV